MVVIIDNIQISYLYHIMGNRNVRQKYVGKIYGGTT